MLYAILFAIAAFLFWVSRKPDSFTLSRQVAINASPAEVFPWINNLKNMNQWNPWASQDAKSVINYEGPEQGPGAIYTWAGGKMGSGRFEIRESEANKAMRSRLQMIKPMAADNSVEFSIQDGNGTTVVIWTMTGKNAFIHKLFQTFMSMDKMVGKEFEKGLAEMKRLVELKKLH